MNRLLYLSLIGLLLMASLSFSDELDANSARLSAYGKAYEYFESELMNKESGVYEHDGLLFVLSKVPLAKTTSVSAKRQATMKAQGNAMLDTNNQLRKWGAKQTEAARNADATPSPALVFASQVLEQYEPDWQWSGWSIKLKTQTIYDQADKGTYSLCLTVDKKTALQAIPPEYSQRCPADKLLKWFSIVAEGCMQSDQPRPRFFERCGVPDVYPDGQYTGPIADEAAKLQERLTAYFATSPFAIQIKEEAKHPEPKTTTEETIEENPQKTRRVKKVVKVTIEEIPRMQELFLAGGREANTPTERLASGTDAIKLLYDSQATPKEKEASLKQALCENPGDKELWNYYGRLLMDRQEPLAAVCCYRNALVLDRQFVYPMVNLSKAYQQLGCNHLAWGLALLAHGLANDEWSIKESEALLLANARQK